MYSDVTLKIIFLIKYETHIYIAAVCRNVPDVSEAYK